MHPRGARRRRRRGRRPGRRLSRRPADGSAGAGQIIGRPTSDATSRANSSSRAICPAPAVVEGLAEAQRVVPHAGVRVLGRAGRRRRLVERARAAGRRRCCRPGPGRSAVRVSRRRQPTSVTAGQRHHPQRRGHRAGRAVAGRHVLAVPEHQPAAVADDDLLPDAVDLVDEAFQGEAEHRSRRAARRRAPPGRPPGRAGRPGRPSPGPGTATSPGRPPAGRRRRPGRLMRRRPSLGVDSRDRSLPTAAVAAGRGAVAGRPRLPPRAYASAPLLGLRRRGGAVTPGRQPARGDQERGVGDHPVVGPHRQPVGVPVAHQRLPGPRLGEAAALAQRLDQLGQLRAWSPRSR